MISVDAALIALQDVQGSEPEGLPEARRHEAGGCRFRISDYSSGSSLYGIWSYSTSESLLVERLQDWGTGSAVSPCRIDKS